ncbi:MAG: hypothetical protein OEZ06_00245 [Myxococcales bacterium]|nr:hypothetical protein [Myxococcales bacterium]
MSDDVPAEMSELREGAAAEEQAADQPEVELLGAAEGEAPMASDMAWIESPDADSDVVDRLLGARGVPSFFPPPTDDDIDSLLSALRPEAEAAEEASDLLVAQAAAESEPPPQSPLEREVVAAAEAKAETEAVSASRQPQAPSEPPAGRAHTPLPPPAVDSDPGATAARARIPRRRTVVRAMQAPEVLGERLSLMEHIAARVDGPARGRLLCGAAEVALRIGERAKARRLYDRALEYGSGDPLPLRELRKLAIAEGDRARAVELVEAELELVLEPAERAYTEALLFELLASSGEGSARLSQLLTSMDDALPEDLLPAALRAGLEAADGLARVAGLWPSKGARARLRGAAAHGLLGAGRVDEARELLDAAERDEGRELLVALLRVRLTASEPSAGAESLAQLCDATPAGSAVADALQRRRARLLAQAGEREAALEALAGTTSAPSETLRLRLSRALERDDEVVVVLSALAGTSAGSRRALWLLDLAQWHARAGRSEPAWQAVADAAVAAPELPYQALVRERLVRLVGQPNFDGSSPAATGDDERTAAAARQAVARPGDSGQAQSELALLEGVEDPRVASLRLDVAIEAGRLPLALEALDRAAQAAGPDRDIGLSLARAELGAGAVDARDDGTALSTMARIASLHLESNDPAGAGLLWLELSRRAEGDFAAYAASTAGDLLSAADRSREAYELALAASPGHLSAAFSLEALLARGADASASRRLQWALGRGAGSDVGERAARSIRAARLAAASSPHDAETFIKDAIELLPHDAVLQAERLRRSAEADGAVPVLELSPYRGRSLGLLGTLRAAMEAEASGDVMRASALYRELLDAPGALAAHADMALERTLEETGNSALLSAADEGRLARAQDLRLKSEMLEERAFTQVASGNLSAAIESFRRLLEIEPASLTALRAVERLAMGRGDRYGLVTCARALGPLVHDSRQRAAYARIAYREGASITDDEGLEDDLWWQSRREAAAVDAGDIAVALEAAMAQAEHFVHPFDATAFLLRSADWVEAQDSTRALSLLRDGAARSPRHPLIHERLGRLCVLAGEYEEAARAYEAAARVAPSDERAQRMYYRSAVLWQDQLGDVARARHVLELACELNPTYRDVFPRLAGLLREAGEERALLELIALRLRHGVDNVEAAELQAERFALLRSMGEADAARRALGKARHLAPQNASVLRSLADIELAEERWASAADALIELARTSQQPSMLHQALSQLGEIYQRHMPDLRRAEIAYSRAVGIRPDDREGIERLVSVYADLGNRDRALRASRRLVELARTEDELDLATVGLATMLMRFGEQRRADTLLDMRRKSRPASVPLIEATAEMYESQLDHPALAVHLDRSIRALGAALAEAPDDVQRWHALIDLLQHREREDAAQVALALARDLGVELKAQALQPARLALGGKAFADSSMRRMWPPALSSSARTLSRWLGERVDRLLPESQQRVALDSDSGLVRTALARSQAWLGGETPRLVGIAGFDCVPLSERPLTLGVGVELCTICDADELAFLMSRALCAARAGLLALARSTPDQIEALCGAASALANPTLGLKDEHREAAARIEALPAGQRRSLETFVFETVTGAELAPGALSALALEAGARLALVAAGSCAVGCRALHASAIHARVVGDGATAVVAAVDRRGPARELLRFALGDVYFEVIGA